jgi:hypothetical protein
MTDDGYRTGPGKPPRQNMWKKGQSGNPKGRPRKKQAETLHEYLVIALLRERRVKIGDDVREVFTREIIIEQLVNLAVKGDKKAIDHIMKIDRQMFETKSVNERGGGVLVVPGRGVASPEAKARGLSLEQELDEQQAPFRNKAVVPPKRGKPE